MTTKLVERQERKATRKVAALQRKEAVLLAKLEKAQARLDGIREEIAGLVSGSEGERQV